MQRLTGPVSGHEPLTVSVAPCTLVCTVGSRQSHCSCSRTMTRWDSVPSRCTFPVPARTTTRSMWRLMVVVVVRSCLNASLTPTEIPHTTSRTPKTSSTSLGVERAIAFECKLNAFR